jgi:hypothetical protein
MARQEGSPVMLSRSEASRYLATDFSLRLRVTPVGSSWRAQVDLSPDGCILVQYANQAGDFSDKAFTKPALTLTSSVANS